MGISWIEYRGHKILYVDYNGTKTPQEMIQILNQQEQIEKTNPTLRILTNYEGSFGSNEYLDKAKEYAKRLRKDSKVKQAILGISGLKKVLYDAYVVLTNDKTLKTFTSEATAKEWLIS